MKLAVVTLATAVVVAAAIEGDDQTGLLYKICGDDLSIALQEACVKKSVDYLLKHGIAFNEREHKLATDNHHRHNRDHDHDHSLSHDHNNSHGHDHSQAGKQDESIMEKCCYKPCLIKDFVAFCGNNIS